MFYIGLNFYILGLYRCLRVCQYGRGYVSCLLQSQLNGAMDAVKDMLGRLPHSVVSFFSSSPDNATPSYRGKGETKRRSSEQDPSVSLVVDKGLTNKPGQNNCFLNAAVQVRMLKLGVPVVFASGSYKGEKFIIAAVRAVYLQL